MRLWRRKPKFTHPCPICQHAGREYPHGGQHAVRYAPGPQITERPSPNRSELVLNQINIEHMITEPGGPGSPGAVEH